MTDESNEQAAIDWEAAEVDDGVLTVPLGGEPSKAWVDRLSHVLEVLQEEGRHGPWESVKASRKELKVSGVRPGTEGDVRYVLEAAVTQANHDLAPDPDEDDGGEGSAADRDSTAAFRAFAEKPEEG